MTRILEVEGPEQSRSSSASPSSRPSARCPRRRVLADRARDLRPLRHPAHHRRGHLRVRPHRPDVEPSTSASNPTCSPWPRGITSRRTCRSARWVHRRGAGADRGLRHLHTYGNHPRIPWAVAVKNLEILQQRDRLVERSATMGAYFLDALRQMQDRPSIGEVRGTGLWLAIDFTSDKTRAPYPTANLMAILARAKEKGVITKTMGTPSSSPRRSRFRRRRSTSR